MTETTSDDLRRRMEKSYAESADSWREVDGRLNIMVAGNTGAGKSTLIREFFGSDLEGPPEVGHDKPTTMEITRHAVPGNPLAILDTRGFETGNADAIAMTEKKINEMRSRGTEAEQLHMVWLCVEQTGARFQPAHESFAKRIIASGVPLIVVVTKSYDDPGQLEKGIIDTLGADVPVVSVVAEAKISRSTTAEVRGLVDLLDQTLYMMPVGRKQALLTAQSVSWEHKDREANAIIGKAALAASSSGLIPVPGGQLVALAGVQGMMMQRLDALAGIPSDDVVVHVKLAALAAARSGGVKLFQLGVAQMLKFLPGIGTAASTVVGAGVGGAITGALGFAYWNASKIAVRSGVLVTAEQFSREFERYRGQGEATGSGVAHTI